MEATATVLADIAKSIRPSAYTNALELGQLVSAGAAVIALLIAALAFAAERSSRSKGELMQLADYFDRMGYFTRMWRIEQLTRTKGAPPLEPMRVESVRALKRPTAIALFNEALASDWAIDRADMFTMYFFALRVRSWVHAGWIPTRRVRQLNNTLGYQLLATMLNHQVVSCRLRKSSLPDNYYPTHYGLFDPAYADVTRLLAKDLLRPGRLQPIIAKPLSDSLEAVTNYLKTLQPMMPKDDPVVIPDGDSTDSASEKRHS